MWDDLSFGWRCWQHQRVRWTFLVFAWGIFSALAVIVTQLTINLSTDRPDWSNSTDSIYTISYGIQGMSVTSKGVDLDYAQTASGVTSYSKYVIKREILKLNGKRKKVSVLFYEPNFFELLDVNDKYDFVKEGGVFSTVALTENIANTKLVVTLGESDAPVLQELPNAFDKFAGKSVDLYIPMMHFTNFVPFKGANATETQAIINSIPYYYGLISVDDNFSVTTATQYIQEQILQSGESVVSTNLEANIQLVSGVELLPQQRKELLRQLIILAILLFSFGFVLISNYFSVVTAIAIERSKELSLKYALGAPNSAQLVSLLRENIPMLLAVVIVALVSALAIQVQLYNSDIYNKYFGSTFEFSWLQWAAVLSICLLIMVCISVLPMFNLLRNSHFNRGKGGLNKTQRRLNDFQFLFQILLTLCALNVSLSSGYQEWQKQRTESLDMKIVGAEVARIDGKPFSLPTKWLLGQDKNVGLSSKALIESRAPLVKLRPLGDSNIGEQFADKISITSNLLAIIGVKWNVFGQLEQGTVIVNMALAKKLAGGSNMRDLIGSQIVIDDAPQKPLVIAGIVHNVDHAGVNLSDIPMLYTLITNEKKVYSPLYIYSNQSILSDQVFASLDLSPKFGRIKLLGDIKQQLTELNKNRRGLLFITLQISLFIFVMLTVGLLYQLKTMLLSQQRIFGLSLAMGQQRKSLYAEKLFKLLTSCLLASIAFIVIMLFLNDYFAQTVSLDVFSIVPVSLSTFLVVISVFSTTLFMLNKLTNTTIQRLLTAQV